MLLAASLPAADFYVSPTGSASGDGSLAKPWDLQTALKQPASVRPGDTLWLRGGRYAGIFTSHLLGTASARITVKPYQKEQPVIDSAGTAGTILQLASDGGYTDYIGLEVKGSAPQRFVADSYGVNLGNVPHNGEGIDVLSSNTRIINCVIHDTAQGLGLWENAPDSEAYGNIIYNNGTDAPDRGHGHGIYTQNLTGRKKLTANVLFSHWSEAFHVYGAAGHLNNYDVEWNVALLGRQLFGGHLPAVNFAVAHNFFFITDDPASAYLTSIRFHYDSQYNAGLVFNDNYVVGVFNAFWWDGITALRNTFFNRASGNQYKFALRSQPGATIGLGFDFDYNRYIRGGAAGDQIGSVAAAGGSNRISYDSLAAWQAAGQDAHGSVVDPPAAPEVFYSPNAWESKRGHVVVVNWTGAATVPVDLAKLGYATGDAYSIWDVQALGDATPLHSGTWAGTPVSVNVAYAGLTMPAGDYSAQCWNVDCATCNPVPAGCYTHPAFRPTKSGSYRAFLVRYVGAPAPIPTPAPAPIPQPKPCRKSRWQFWKKCPAD